MLLRRVLTLTLGSLGLLLLLLLLRLGLGALQVEEGQVEQPPSFDMAHLKSTASSCACTIYIGVASRRQPPVKWGRQGACVDCCAHAASSNLSQSRRPPAGRNWLRAVRRRVGAALPLEEKHLSSCGRVCSLWCIGLQPLVRRVCSLWCIGLQPLVRRVAASGA